MQQFIPLEFDCLPLITKSYEGKARAIAITPDGQRIVSGGVDGIIKVRDINTGEEVSSRKLHETEVVDIVLTPDGTKGISASLDGAIKVWDLERIKLLHTLTLEPGDGELQNEVEENSINSLAIFPNGEVIAAGYTEQRIRFWNILTGQYIETLRGHSELEILSGHYAPITSVILTQDGTKIISGTQEQSFKIWDLATGRIITPKDDYSSTSINSIVQIDGGRFITASENSLAAWSLKTGEQLFTLEGHTDEVVDLVVTPDSKWLISASRDKTLRVWDLSHRRMVRGWRGEHHISCCSITPDSRKLIIGDELGIYVVELALPNISNEFSTSVTVDDFQEETQKSYRIDIGTPFKKNTNFSKIYIETARFISYESLKTLRIEIVRYLSTINYREYFDQIYQETRNLTSLFFRHPQKLPTLSWLKIILLLSIVISISPKLTNILSPLLIDRISPIIKSLIAQNIRDYLVILPDVKLLLLVFIGSLLGTLMTFITEGIPRKKEIFSPTPNSSTGVAGACLGIFLWLYAIITAYNGIFYGASSISNLSIKNQNWTIIFLVIIGAIFGEIIEQSIRELIPDAITFIDKKIRRLKNKLPIDKVPSRKFSLIGKVGEVTSKVINIEVAKKILTVSSLAIISAYLNNILILISGLLGNISLVNILCWTIIISYWIIIFAELRSKVFNSFKSINKKIEIIEPWLYLKAAEGWITWIGIIFGAFFAIWTKQYLEPSYPYLTLSIQATLGALAATEHLVGPLLGASLGIISGIHFQFSAILMIVATLGQIIGGILGAFWGLIVGLIFGLFAGLILAITPAITWIGLTKMYNRSLMVLKNQGLNTLFSGAITTTIIVIGVSLCTKLITSFLINLTSNF